MGYNLIRIIFPIVNVDRFINLPSKVKCVDGNFYGTEVPSINAEICKEVLDYQENTEK